MEKLHQSQVKAYREAAVQSVKEWALSFPLQPMDEGDSKITFVNRCIASIVASAAKEMPNWKLDNAKVTAMNEIRKRAIATFEKYHPVEDAPSKESEKSAAVAVVSGDAGTADEADDDSEEGAETEDGELTGDEGTASDQEQTTGKYVHPNKRKNKVAGIKKAVAQKKGKNIKKGFRNNKGGRGAWRGGRGGGGRGNQK